MEVGNHADPSSARGEEMLRAATVLIVEDEQLVALDLKGHLERLGYRVMDMVASGAEACDTASRTQPDLILMDVRLEGPMDGIEAAQRIRQVCEAPIVFLTAYSDAATLERAKQVEPYGYLVKPFAPSDLHAAIQMALYKGNVDRALRESYANLRAILDAQRHGTVMLDADFRLQFASTAACRMTGVHDAPAPGRSLADFLPLSAEQLAALVEISRRPPGATQQTPVGSGRR